MNCNVIYEIKELQEDTVRIGHIIDVDMWILILLGKFSHIIGAALFIVLVIVCFSNH